MSQMFAPFERLSEPQARLQWRFTSDGKEPYGSNLDSVILVGDRVYAFGAGSNSVRCALLWYCTGEWKTVDTSLIPQFGRAGALAGDKIYMYGGLLQLNGMSCSKDLVEFDIVLGDMQVVRSATIGPGYRSYMSAVYAEWRDEIVVFGGLVNQAQTSCRNDMYTWNVDDKYWAKVSANSQLPPARSGHSATLEGFKMFVFGGKGAVEECNNDIWIADLRSLDKGSVLWSRVQDIGQSPVPRSFACFSKLNNRIFLYGGVKNAKPVRSSICAYLPKQRRWMTSGVEGVRITGFPPVWSNLGTKAVELADSILYITQDGLYELEERR